VSESDASLVSRALTGDLAAYSTLMARYRSDLGRYAFHMLGDRHDAEEALQDAFVRAFRSLAQCEQPERFAAWLFQILVNRCRTARTRRRRLTAAFVHHPAPDLADHSQPAEAMAWREEIGRALGALQPNQREAFLLRHVEGLSYEEMATLTGVGESALRMRVKRARDRMRELLMDVYVGGP
jgi:RNA polymerase sigma-70 factor (ECF subfamily)